MIDMLKCSDSGMDLRRLADSDTCSFLVPLRKFYALSEHKCQRKGSMVLDIDQSEYS